MFDAAAEITKAVRNKKEKNRMDKRKETYRPHLLSALIYTSHLRREICHLCEIYLGKNHHVLGKIGQVR